MKGIMMALYTNKMDVFDYATYWRIIIMLLEKKMAFFIILRLLSFLL